MVGKNPPLPRAYPAFRFTSALATILLFITFGLNFLRPQLASPAPAFGMGGGGAPDTFAAEAAPATQAPAATEAPAAQEPSVAMAPMPTQTIPAQEDTARAAVETPAEKNGAAANGIEGGLPEQQLQAPQAAPVVPQLWQWLLAGLALLSAFVMALMRQLSINRWRKK